MIKPHERKPRRKINSFKIVTISKPYKIGEADSFNELSEEDIANLIVSAINAAGQDGSVIVEAAKGFKSELIVVDGFNGFG